MRAIGRLGQGAGVFARGVARDPNWRAISRRGRPWILACCAAFQCRQLPRGQFPACRKGSFSNALADWTGFSSTGSGPRLGSSRNWGWLRRWLPRRFTTRLNSGVGAMVPREARNTPAAAVPAGRG